MGRILAPVPREEPSSAYVVSHLGLMELELRTCRC